MRILLRTGCLGLAALLLLGACGSKGKPSDSPQSFAVAQGDGQAVVTWTQDSSLQYWIFLAQAPVISLSDYFNQPGARVVTPVNSPQIIAGLANNLPYSFIMNATRNGGPAGPTTPSISVTPRLAGASWMSASGTGLPPGTNFTGIAYGGGQFVAVGQGNAIFAGSYTGVGGIAWSQRTSIFPAGTNINAVAWSGVVFVAVGDGGNIEYSGDTVTWSATSSTSGTTHNLRGITLGPGAYVAVGDAGTIITSTDLINWTPQTVPSPTANLVGVSNVAGTVLAMGDNGTLWTSANTTTWTTTNKPALSGITLRGAAFGVGTAAPYVVVGDNGTVLTSTDAMNFTLQPSPVGTANLRSLWYGSRFLAVGASGATFYSDNGTGWTAGTVTPAIPQNLNGVVFGNGAYEAIGDAGANAQSN